jgi:predicted nuclease of restriction endonuclease-like (RecB) superfamily
MKKSIKIKPIDTTYQSVKQVLEEARKKAYSAVNFAMVQAYWNIGRIIVEEEQKGKATAGYGEYLISELAARLTAEFGKGFTISNIKYFRQFYLSFSIGHALRGQSQITGKMNDAVRHKFQSMTKSHAVRDELPLIRPELSWTHYRLLLKVERSDVRKFYLDECIVANWSTRQLERQINSFYYERLLSSRNKGGVRSEIKKLEPEATPHDVIKDPYVLEFLGMRESREYLETDLEQGLIDKLHDFLLELGKGFSFVCRQKRITIDGDHFYIDLVFYNYFLKCFVLIDLKVGKLTHQDIGQMDFYIRYFEKEVKLPGDNPTIGLILCAEKNEAMAKYTLLKGSKTLFASKYKLYLPTEKELKEELKRERQLLELEMKGRKQ